MIRSKLTNKFLKERTKVTKKNIANKEIFVLPYLEAS